MEIISLPLGKKKNIFLKTNNFFILAKDKKYFPHSKK